MFFIKMHAIEPSVDPVDRSIIFRDCIESYSNNFGLVGGETFIEEGVFEMHEQTVRGLFFYKENASEASA
jgi:hypothetical protein